MYRYFMRTCGSTDYPAKPERGPCAPLTAGGESQDVVGPWLTRADARWRWDEGPCPCGGIMRRRPGGDVGRWHRICDTCGSHYELQPLVIHIGPGGELSVPGSCDPEAVARAEALIEQIRRERPAEEVGRRGVIYGGWAVRTSFPA